MHGAVPVPEHQTKVAGASIVGACIAKHPTVTLIYLFGVVVLQAFYGRGAHRQWRGGRIPLLPVHVQLRVHGRRPAQEREIALSWAAKVRMLLGLWLGVVINPTCFACLPACWRDSQLCCWRHFYHFTV